MGQTLYTASLANRRLALKSRDGFRHVGGQTNRLLRETMAASWDHERSVTQIFALIASLFRKKKTIFSHGL